MPNPVRGEVPLKLSDGREFVLVADMEAMVTAESLYGKPVEQVFADAVRGFTGATRAIFYGMLQAHHPEVTPREALDILTADKAAVTKSLEAAASASKPKESAGGKEGANPPGTSSGSNGAKRGSSRKSSGAKRRAPTRSSSARA